MRIEDSLYPKARQLRLIVRELPDELLIYDLDRDAAFCLNRFSREVWRRCDGENTTERIAQSLEKTFGSIDENLVWLAIEQLAQHNLLERRPDRPHGVARMTRREAVRRIGIGSAIAIPLVTSIISPAPTQAASCSAACHPCNANSDCCSGVCINNPPGCQAGTTRCM